MQALTKLKQSNLRSNQQAVGDLSALLKLGNGQLETVFRELLREGSARPVDPLEYVAKSTGALWHCWSPLLIYGR